MAGKASWSQCELQSPKLMPLETRVNTKQRDFVTADTSLHYSENVCNLEGMNLLCLVLAGY